MTDTSARPYFLEEQMAWGTDLHSLVDGCKPSVQGSGRGMEKREEEG